MKKTIQQHIALFILSFVVFSLFSFKVIENGGIKGWFIAGSQRDAYEIGTVHDPDREGKVAYLKSIKNVKKNKFGTIMQSFDAKDYLGKKVKLTGFIKTKELKSWAGMWMRVDGENGKLLSFDNMGDRKIEGETPWTKYAIILNVPKSSLTINYGVLLSETGIIWIDDLSFEVVGIAEETTGKDLLKAPKNSSFED